MLLDLVDGAIQGGDDLFSLARGDGVAGNLVPEGISDLAQGAEGVARVLLAQTLRADGVGTGFAVGVNFYSEVFLAAGNPLHDGISGQGVFNGNLLVSSSGLASLMQLGAALAEIFAVIDAVRGGIFVFTEIALHHPVPVSFWALASESMKVMHSKDLTPPVEGTVKGALHWWQQSARAAGAGMEDRSVST